MQEWIIITDTGGRYAANFNGIIKDMSLNKIMNPNPKKDRYNRVRLILDNKPVMVSVHRLIAKTFLANKDGKRVVNHINGKKGDNRVSNLEWATYSENTYHAHAIGLRPKKPYTTLVKIDLTKNEFVEFKSIADKTGLSCGALAKSILVSYLNTIK